MQAELSGGRQRFRNLHTKFYMFSQAGTSEDVLPVGSPNFTRNAAVHQWNDLYFTDGDHELFRQFVALFKDMSKDYGTRQSRGTSAASRSARRATTRSTSTQPSRSPGLAAEGRPGGHHARPDPVPDPRPGDRQGKRTHLALSMHTMRGARGDYLAEAIRQKWVQGCDVRVTYGLIGYQTKRVSGRRRRGRFRSGRRGRTTTPTTTSTSTTTATTT